MKITSVNAITGEIIERDMTPEEIAAREIEVAVWQTEKQAQTEAIAEAQAKRQALLGKLGITEDEAKLLLGGN